MKSAALLMCVLITVCGSAIARPYHGHHHYVVRMNRDTNRSSERESHSGITCEMVRAYVAQVGLAQAAAMAQAAGITSSEKERARRCLADKS